MMHGPEDKSHPETLHKAIAVHWSKRRAYHQDKVKLSVRTELVKDGAKVDIEIQTRDGKVVIDDVKDLAVKDGKIDHDYTIDWKGKHFRPPDREFVAIAILTGAYPIRSQPSAPLWVDLATPLLSV